ncbi:hypothetical protein KKD95_00460 [Patescibacteria group bacterium]|nr:hypothetical protein [Patescibacteria group bacterium]
MKAGGVGGANTRTGLFFETRSDLIEAIKVVDGYEVAKSGEISFKGKPVAISLRKNALYKYLEKKGLDYKTVLSKRLLPDEAILVYETNTLYVIEMKFQSIAGSVDEKLQTCDFKRKQYIRLLTSLNIGVEYFYILNDWFKDPAYRDVLAYIKEVNCDYFFNEIELNLLGLPAVHSDDSIESPE